MGEDEISAKCNVPNKLPRQPEERLLEIVVRFSRNFKVLQILLSVEGHCTGLHFALLMKGACEICTKEVKIEFDRP